jgi:hypothetical protein
MPAIQFSPTKDDLFHPARRGQFFAGGRPRGEAALCAELCRLAYCRPEPHFKLDQQTISSALAPLEFTGVCFDSEGTPDGRGSHAILTRGIDQAHGGPLTVVAFRGTDADDPTDLGDDADSLQTNWGPGGRVHRGFAHALNDLLPRLTDALAGVQGRVLFTGHSLGAAMATLLASIRRPDALHTFGSPRVGDPDFVSTLAGIGGRRYVHCCDAVPRVPPESLLGLRFAHVGDTYYIDRTGAIAVNPPTDVIDNDRLAAAASYLVQFAWRNGNVAVRELADHAPINYVFAVAADASQP